MASLRTCRMFPKQTHQTQGARRGMKTWLLTHPSRLGQKSLGTLRFISGWREMSVGGSRLGVWATNGDVSSKERRDLVVS